jgi:hypothetical protein
MNCPKNNELVLGIKSEGDWITWRIKEIFTTALHDFLFLFAMQF